MAEMMKSQKNMTPDKMQTKPNASSFIIESSLGKFKIPCKLLAMSILMAFCRLESRLAPTAK